MPESALITELQPTDRASESRVTLNENFAARHSFGFTPIDHTDSPYAVAADDQVIVANGAGGAITINLPAVASSESRSVVIVAKSVAGGNVTIDGASSETINGATTKVLSAAYASCRLSCDGSEWFAH